MTVITSLCLIILEEHGFKEQYLCPVSSKVAKKKGERMNCSSHKTNNLQHRPSFKTLCFYRLLLIDSFKSSVNQKLSDSLLLSIPGFPSSGFPLTCPLLFPRSPRSDVHCHVLQRAVRQVRHTTAVRLLPVLGPQLGVPEEGHHGGDHQLRRRHHQPAGKMAAASGRLRFPGRERAKRAGVTK